MARGRRDQQRRKFDADPASWTGKLTSEGERLGKATKTSLSTPLKAIVLTLACLCIAPSFADVLFGRVVGVADGDTFTLMDTDCSTHKIRLSGIDAPEKAQPFGERAKQQLSDWVFDENVQVIYGKSDCYGWLVGKIIKDGQGVNIQMVHAGLAWHYKAYEGEQPALDRVTYPQAELNAERKAMGLWSDENPVTPWEWRSNKRHSGK